MKIALLGNMNNNNFAMMRYFRDLGEDAHLLLWSNDGLGTVSHFSPENDTWNIDAWRPYIHRMDVSDSYTAVVGAPKSLRPPPSTAALRKLLDGFDAVIGAGIAPALLLRFGKTLDIFYPYSLGIEYVDYPTFLMDVKASGFLRRKLLEYCRRRQIEGIRRARFCLNADMGATRDAFVTMGKAFEPLAIPMVYNREVAKDEALPEVLRKAADKIRSSTFACFSHARHVWVPEPGASGEWQKENKKTDWVVRGFASFLQASPGSGRLLVMLEYGPDVSHTKDLIRELGIADNVLWLPKASRKEVTYLLGLCHVGVGAFLTGKGTLWGGASWEVLAAGKPILQSFNFAPGEFEAAFGHPAPPMLDVQSPEDVATHLTAMAADPVAAARMGREARAWFDRYNGIRLAEQWLEVLRRPRVD